MSAIATIDIVPAMPADVPRIAEALARAFQDDPVHEWLLEDPRTRRARLPAVMAAFVEHFLPLGETYLAAEGAGAALWAPAGIDPYAGEGVEMLDERLAAALGHHADRAQVVGELFDQHHPGDPCFYLQYLGVVPEHQGRGVGSRLLTSVLERCDETRTPAYLEATSHGNRRLYQRHGFDTVGEITLPDGPTVWPMWRDPVTAPAGAEA